jgi:hypothetical protein
MSWFAILGPALVLAGSCRHEQAHQADPSRPNPIVTHQVERKRSEDEERAIAGACAYLAKRGISCDPSDKYEAERVDEWWSVSIADRPAKPGGEMIVNLDSNFRDVSLIPGM